MSNNKSITTEVPQSSSGEGPKKIHQKGSKKRINNHQTNDIVGNLHQDNQPTSEYNYPSHVPQNHRQQQQDYGNILLQQRDIFPEEYTVCSAVALLDDSSYPTYLAEDFVSDNYAAKSFGHGGGGAAAAACGSADSTILQPSYGIDSTEENNFNCNARHPKTPRLLLKKKSRCANSLQGGGVLTSSNEYDSGWRHINKSKLWNNKVSKDFVPEKLSSFFVEGEEDEDDVEVRTAADTLHAGDIDGNKRPYAFFSGSNSEEVMPFLHGDEVSKEFNHFKDPKHAKNWSNKYFNGSHGRGTSADASGYSATAVVRTNSDDEVVVVVTKEAYIKYGESEGIKKSHKTDKPIAPTPYVPSTFQPTVESLTHDWCASAVMTSFLKELNDEGTTTPTISPVEWALKNHLEYRRRHSTMSQEERITFLEKGCANYIQLLVDVLGSVKGGKYLELLNFGSPLSTKHTGGSLHHYVTINALRSLQTELDKANHNGCLSRDRCIGVFTKMLARMMMRSITDKSSGVDISETVVALNDLLVVGLPNTTLNEYGEKRTLTTEDKKRETETVCNDFGMTREGEADETQLHSISFFLSGYRFELCVAVHGKAFLLLPSTHKACISYHKSVDTTGRATDHVDVIKRAFHGQKFHDETIKDASPQVLAAMNNSLSLFLIEILSDIYPHLNIERVVHTLASDFCVKLTPEQREFQMQEWKKTGKKLGKKTSSAWELYNGMTGAVVPTDMTDDMMIMLVGKNCTKVSWVAHKTGPNAANRVVEIAAIEAAYRVIVEKRRLAAEEKLVNAELHRVFEKKQLKMSGIKEPGPNEVMTGRGIRAHIEKPGPNDVISGRGGGSNNHPGNVKFRRIVEDLKPTYQASTRQEKTKLSTKVVADWRAMDPSGRFLKENEETGLWDDVGDKEARKKCTLIFCSKKRKAAEVEPMDSVGASANLMQKQIEFNAATTLHSQEVCNLLIASAARGESSVDVDAILICRNKTLAAMRRVNLQCLPESVLMKRVGEAEQTATQLYIQQKHGKEEAKRYTYPKETVREVVVSHDGHEYKVGDQVVSYGLQYEILDFNATCRRVKLRGIAGTFTDDISNIKPISCLLEQKEKEKQRQEALTNMQFAVATRTYLPNASEAGKLSFQAGDVIMLNLSLTGNGWIMGCKHGKEDPGWCLLSYLKKFDTQSDAKLYADTLTNNQA